MKRIHQLAIVGVILVSAVVLWMGCHNTADQLDTGWTPPVVVSSSIGDLGGWFYLHRRKDTIVGLKPQRGGPPQCLLLDQDGKSWSELPVTGVPNEFPPYSAVDPQSSQISLADGYAENEQLVMKVFMGTVTKSAGLRSISEKVWVTDKKALLGVTGPNIRLNESGLREGVVLGQSILDGSEGYVPFSLDAHTYFGVNNVSNGPFANGVFHSVDPGKTWQLEKVSEQRAIAPALCKTTAHVYYFGGTSPLWFSRKPTAAGQWANPQAVARTFAMAYGRYDVAGEGDTAHICWMDRRHNKWRFNLTGPPNENNDIYYRRRKDSDREWSQEVLLSKGLLYCYAPTLSAEGDNTVVVWAGIQTANKQHTYLGPNDIYYVTSKDAGKTWTSPLRVTDGAKDGITAGMPRVTLLKGVIHLLYTQGAQRTNVELSPGLTKLGEGSWPIYYQQRSFPN